MRLLCPVLLILLWFCSPVQGQRFTAEQLELFEAKIRPMLLSTCFRCHGDGKTSGSLKVDSREALLKGGDSGPAIVPGQPESSLLIRAIQRKDGVAAMPPEK